jgi:hypothetical protein
MCPIGIPIPEQEPIMPSRHSTDGISPFANVAISDETAENWANATDEYACTPMRIGKHRTDIDRAIDALLWENAE